MSEPIQSGSELYEGQKRGRELFVAGGDAAEYFKVGKEIFDVVAMPVVTAMESSRLVATPARRDTAAGTLRAQGGAETIGVEALVGHDPVARARNSGQRYNAAGDQLEALGSKPILLEGVTVELTWPRLAGATIQILDHDGLRTGRTLKPDADGKVRLDGARDQAYLYEISFPRPLAKDSRSEERSPTISSGRRPATIASTLSTLTPGPSARMPQDPLTGFATFSVPTVPSSHEPATLHHL